MFENIGFEMEFDTQGKSILALTCARFWGAWFSMLIPLLFGRIIYIEL